MKRRPCPTDFHAKFVALGWDGTASHYRTHPHVIRRWLGEAGREALTAERAAYVARLRERDRAFRLRAARLGSSHDRLERLPA